MTASSGNSSSSRRSGSKPSKFRRQRRKVCMFCVDKITLDYKQVASGRARNKLVTERGKIVPRRITGTCAKHQRMVTEAIKQARHIALLPYVTD